MTSLNHAPVRLTLAAATVAVVAATLTLSAQPAQSASLLGLPGAESGAGQGAGAGAEAAPTGTLPPATRRTKPYRAQQTGVCDDVDNVCTYSFGRVRDNKLLEIRNVSCVALVPDTQFSKYAFLSTTGDPGATGLVATLPAEQVEALGSSSLIIINSSGPYFFQGGNDVYVVSGGSQGRCTISGYLSRTD